jgi:hypothetical protein
VTFQSVGLVIGQQTWGRSAFSSTTFSPGT